MAAAQEAVCWAGVMMCLRRAKVAQENPGESPLVCGGTSGGTSLRMRGEDLSHLTQNGGQR